MGANGIHHRGAENTETFLIKIVGVLGVSVVNPRPPQRATRGNGFTTEAQRTQRTKRFF
jgi:hypothetical protein